MVDCPISNVLQEGFQNPISRSSFSIISTSLPALRVSIEKCCLIKSGLAWELWTGFWIRSEMRTIDRLSATAIQTLTMRKIIGSAKEMHFPFVNNTTCASHSIIVKLVSSIRNHQLISIATDKISISCPIAGCSPLVQRSLDSFSAYRTENVTNRLSERFSGSLPSSL